jgi:hypothetical protein
MMMCSSRSGLLTVVLCLGWALVCGGCGGGLQEGFPSNIDPNKPSATVKAMLQQSAAAKRAAEDARSKGKKTQASPSPEAMPKKPSQQAPE